MKPNIYSFLAWLLLSSLSAAAQQTVTVMNNEGEPLIGAYVWLLPDSTVLGETNLEGKMRINQELKPTQRLQTSYLGHEDLSISWREVLRANGQIMLAVDEGFSTLAPVVVGRRNEAYTQLPYQIKTVDQQAISQAQSLTTADALADLSGVYVQKSQFGGGSPVVRGFEANRVLLVVDGVRMNNAIYRNGHLQNAITVDALALDRMELIFGAGALAYGSDAIGGVVHFRTQQPEFRARTQDAVEGQGAMNFSSAAKALTLGGKLSYGAENWAGLTLLSTTSTSHLRAGAQRPDRYPDFGLRTQYIDRVRNEDRLEENEDPNVQIGTAYSQFNLLQKLRFHLKDQLELSANMQLSTTTDVPRYDALTERSGGALRFARWDYGPQTRAMASLRLDDRRPTALYDIATYLISHQLIEEDRISRRVNDPLEENNLETVQATNLQTDFAKEVGFWTVRYGLDLRYDGVKSEAYFRDINSVENRRLDGLATRYPSGGSSLAAGGIYLDAGYDLGKDWLIRGGLRLSRQRLSATFQPTDPVEWPTEYLDGISNTESAATAALGLRHEGKTHGFRALYAQGFRAPNIDDFAKFRESNGFIQVPNPNLQPERSHTLEASYRNGKAGGDWWVELTAYHSWLRSAIVRRNGILPDGSSFFVSRRDTLFAQTNVNAESARVYGFDVSARWRFAPDLTLLADAHALRGIRRQAAPDGVILSLPQDHIPPPYGSLTLRYDNQQWAAGLRLRGQLAKNPEDYAVGEITGTAGNYTFSRLGTADNLELTPYLSEEDRFAGSYAWWTANLFAEYRASERWTFRFKVDNLFDRHYRTFASGVSAAGIDVGVGVGVAF
ncbi:TonB-dependent receptor [Neolewinella agarilytica]|uniref:Hemoglobin/transferrin/lactoferrin receptor protein n=1 Tax=Neolewinella agarilytica TaxID=478744 RepID=A0A1H9GXL5_9BACT|nr:TonB-dependent receptor [Neolewinella agarilytica]SEQ54748.1 hemoglobin/transferrin/lactoferrin receptor protein [Neolewinella agarilytica]